ncbi:MAG: CotH kinase family protein, partial [Planctomycetales bacterium]|nr:CotH kinase family protein [Planctomycetales bacterium]
APTPGAANSVLTQNAAPQLRQVNHTPREPQAGEAVVVTVHATDPDGVGTVNLQYQLVNPGDYISDTDPRYATDWTTIAMHDDGLEGDATANDGIYSVTLPASLQTHRRLVRYRIDAVDTPGAAVSVPYADDPVPNFAYFVYNGVPDWTGSADPGTAPDVTYSSDLLTSIPVYQLITTQKDHVDSQYVSDSTRGSGYTGSDYLWQGTMVYDGVVYDHISYRARGGVWRYAMGKNMWKFDFARGHEFQARDNYGNKYGTTWDKLNFSAIIQQGDYLHRGEQGLFESVGFELFNLAGVQAPNTNYVHFRIIESADENGSTQYNGDFQGLYLAIEQVDGNFLDEHDLPDGNMYKIESYAPESTTNQGATEPTGGRDVRDFINASRSKQPGVEYWEQNLDLQHWYSYQTIAHGIHHYDTQDGKNYFYFHNPDTGLWQIVPWDLDLTWANNMYGGENHQLNVRVSRYNGFNEYTNQANIDLNNRFNYDYQNRVRELLDLLYNPEQTGMLIDQMASFVYQPGEISIVDADRAMWDENPINSVASRYTNNSKNNTNSRYKFYERASTKDYAGMIQILKDYIDNRTTGLFYRSILSNEANIPTTPLLTYTGAPNYGTHGLTFQTNDFASPIGASFAAMKWRIAEVTDPNAPGFDPYDRTADRKYEIESNWESDVLTEFNADVKIPGERLEPGKTYRVRVRMQDNDGHWSHWSDAIQFTATAGVDGDLASSLRISEINYNPGASTGAEAAAGFSDNNDFEFIELVNIGSQTLNLAAASLDAVTIDGNNEGVEFSFADGQVTQLAPGGRVLVVENQAAFEMRYGTGLPVAGEWSGRLGNSSETLTLSAYGTVIQQFAYRDSWHTDTDGQGATLEVVNAANPNLDVWGTAAGWTASAVAGGTPGQGVGTNVPGDSNLDGVFNSSDLVFVFQRGEYEDDIIGNSTWEDGDWNNDGEFDSADFVYAFSFGSYVVGALPIAATRTESTVVAGAPGDALSIDELAAAVDEVFDARDWEEL